MNDPFDGELTGDTSILRVRVRELESENDKLRGILSKSDLDCIYCGLPKKDMGRCYFGFPGCGRADDLMSEANDGRKPEPAK